MAPLPDRLFEQHGNIPADRLPTLEARDLQTDIARVLGATGWNGTGTAAAVGLELSQDNQRILASRFCMVGLLSQEPGRIQAAKLWDKADKEAVVTFEFPTGQEFNFNAGTLQSDYLSQENVKMAVSKNGVAVPRADWRAAGIGDFCLRMLATLDRSSTGRRAELAMKFVVLFFPHSPADVQEISDQSQGAGWPGVKILEGKAALLPRAPDGSWGCPIFPIIAPGTSFNQLPTVPPGAEIRYHVAKLMTTARRAVSCTSHSALIAKWKKMVDDEEQYQEVIPSTTWPAPALPANSNGKLKD